MKKEELLNLLDNVQEHGEETAEADRILLIDGLNLKNDTPSMQIHTRPSSAIWIPKS